MTNIWKTIQRPIFTFDREALQRKIDLLFSLYEEDDQVDQGAEQGQGDYGNRHDGHRQRVDCVVVQALAGSFNERNRIN